MTLGTSGNHASMHLKVAWGTLINMEATRWRNGEDEEREPKRDGTRFENVGGRRLA